MLHRTHVLVELFNTIYRNVKLNEQRIWLIRRWSLLRVPYPCSNGTTRRTQKPTFSSPFAPSSSLKPVRRVLWDSIPHPLSVHRHRPITRPSQLQTYHIYRGCNCFVIAVAGLYLTDFVAAIHKGYQIYEVPAG